MIAFKKLEEVHIHKFYILRALKHFMALVSFYTPENIRKILLFLFSGGIERDQWHEMV